ncbi:collagen binding domain-containing protein [Rhizorhabdus argentea]|uniref:hypothetical protein n=1 Tax=Rhizorhabdus argentea TaxID=1387174 RepID=UPI0030EF1DE2
MARAAPELLTDDNLLLVEVMLDQLSLTDSLGAYDSAGGLLIPIGELARLLDVDLAVQLGERRIVGTIGQARRPVLVDVASGTVRVAAVSQPLSPNDIVVGANEIYVRAPLLEKILPVRATYDGSALRLTLVALEALPIQSRLTRLKNMRGLKGDGGGGEDVYRIKSSAALATLPSLDVSLEAGGQKRTPHTPYRYDVRAGGDLLFSNFQGYVGSDQAGKPVTARALLERRDAGGNALGPLGLTRVAAGDIFTPALSLGPRSLGGRGISFSSAPLTQQSVFGRIDLRGELPLGYDVELYVNDVLRSGQATPVQGRYEFRDVPLIRGINIIRIVAYGPRGERSEEVRVVNVGGGQLEKGQFVLDFGAAQQEKPLIDLRDKESGAITSPGVGDLRVAMNLLYGLTETLTLAGGVASYSPTGLGERRIVTAGIRTSLRGIATQIDAARDDRGGGGLALALAGDLAGVSAVIRHSEYRRGFVDETVPRGSGGMALARSSALDMDVQLKAWKDFGLPVSMRVSRDEFANGDLSWNGLVRASSPVGGVYLSTGLDFERLDPVGASPTNRLSGILSASSFAMFKWQLRANVDYTVLPVAAVRALSVTADRDLSEKTALRLGAGHSFGGESATTLQMAATRRFGFADMALSAEYSAPHSDWRIGLQLAFSLVRNPLGGGYGLQRPGAASGGNMALQAFIDQNGNGRFDKDEAPVAGVVMSGSAGDIATDAKGRGLVTGLGYGSIAQVRTNLDNVALDNIAAPPSVIEFTPRAGTVAVVDYPIQAKGEVMITIFVQRAEKRVGLSAVMLRAVNQKGEEYEGVTEYDGSALFDSLRPGTYHLELGEAQARRLNMRLEQPVSFTISSEGGAAPDVQAVVVFDDAR